MSRSNQVKVQFKLHPNDQQGFQTESLWAENVGRGRFRILNSPFFVFGISCDDVVEAKEAAVGLLFQSVVSRGGHSTYRIFLQDDRTIRDADFRIYWEPISALGATFENADDYFVAVDIPPGKDLGAIHELLEKGEEDGVWAFEEAYYAGRKQ
ncbi:MAG TPA: DUF4265 domain-containing protein [Candidatus Angelobacter sp.]